MHFTFAAVLGLCSATALAAHTLDTRADRKTNLYVCTEKAWAGTCKNVELTIGKCYNMGKAFDKNVSSAGPDDGTFCTLYSEQGCRGKAIPFTNPGIGNFDKYQFDNELSSVRCDLIWGWPKKSG
ncbi:hypothetical protein C7974DRAFT_27610 [Boeremia exigua]|uniref:uncharacterized protein n=1 Tax=Boeremia exigua TaxID=749465 RepID=UPI001E8E3486|nr:uncharacterized protein C7974DRAFT_27610 [Boeremia exigua]KAH6644774.1 hypothetical protein C7974DRAFT_27610 [Boeremia exigua]